ncbi:MAG: sulfatase-like hydrolase/transferase [Bacteroidales bacterium]|nr:sulfatase-like hydrolase/transferase [Bacteroidales bacterium]
MSKINIRYRKKMNRYLMMMLMAALPVAVSGAIPGHGRAVYAEDVTAMVAEGGAVKFAGDAIAMFAGGDDGALSGHGTAEYPRDKDAGGSGAAGVPPNVIVILLDDLGYADVGFNGCTDIPTPNIDRIADEGIRFTQGYVTYAVCGPSRAGLITGRYQDRFGFGHNPLLAPNDPGQGLPLSEETMATVLARVGYRSMALGKWHLGAHRSQWPLNRGFDAFFGFLSGGHRYFPEEWTLAELSEINGQWDGYLTRLMRNDGRVDEQEYLTDALSREAVDFTERMAGIEAPFFLYLAYNAPHTPLQATEKYLARFAHITNQKRRTYAAMVSAVDDGVGLLLDKLEELDIEDETLVFFLSDNGGPEEANGSDNGPLREGKGSLYEGGIHVPFAVCWPGALPAGAVYEKPVVSLDIMATAAALAGADTRNPLDGVNLVPYLTGKVAGAPHDQLFWRKFDQQWYAVRSHDTKMLHRQGSAPELYDLGQDPGEKENLAGVNDTENWTATERGTATETATRKRQPAGTGVANTTGNLADTTTRIDNLAQAYAEWSAGMKDPVFLGLMQNNEYDQLHPDRYAIPDPRSPGQGTPKSRNGYRLTWSEEFNTAGRPDTTKWSHEQGFVRNNELQWYQPENAVVQDGVLVITGKREQVDNPKYKPRSKDWRRSRSAAAYTSASINTREKYSFMYGMMEVRARIDTSMGSWPAIWTLGINRRWPANGEVDMMEYYRVEGEPTILANAAWGSQERWEPVWDGVKVPFATFMEKDPEWHEKFHIWKMEWDEDHIRLYLDEQLLNEIHVDEVTYTDGFNPFRQPHYILLNLALGANGGDPDDTKFPITYEVDYVRVYEKLHGHDDSQAPDHLDL